MVPEDVALVGRYLEALTEAMRRRDLEAAVALFLDDCVLYGSEEGEFGLGKEGVRRFFERLYERPQTYGWTDWEPTCTGRVGEAIWFISPCAVEMIGDDGSVARLPYRLSLLLEKDDEGSYGFRFVNGSQPWEP